MSGLTLALVTFFLASTGPGTPLRSGSNPIHRPRYAAYDPWCASQHRSPDRPLLLRCHALAVHNCCARTNMSAFANPYLIPELIMNPVPEPGEPPKTKVMVHGLPGSKFTRQHAPTDAAFEHIKDGIRNLAQINSPLSSFGFRCWKQRLNQRPLRRRQIARIGKLIHPTTILHAFSDRF
jgi:hypothetical protein